MQTADRIQQQIDEMRAHAEFRVAVANEHRTLVNDRKSVAECELTKFKTLAEGVTLAERVVLQRKEQTFATQPPVSQSVLNGIDGALEEIRRLLRQVQDATLRHEGSFVAFGAMEETFKQEAIQAVSRLRGLEVQGSRAVEVAQRSVVEAAPAPTAPPEAAVESETKEPISSAKPVAPKRKR